MGFISHAWVFESQFAQIASRQAVSRLCSVDNSVVSSGESEDADDADGNKMRHNHAIAGALVAALLAYFDVVACGQCIVYLWPYFGLKSFLIAGSIRSKYKSATPAARAGLPALRYGWSPYEFIGGDDLGLVFYPGAPPSLISINAIDATLFLVHTQARPSRLPHTPHSAGALRRRPRLLWF